MEYRLSSILPGVALLVGIGASARLIADVTGLNHLILAIVLGMAIVNLHGVPAWAERGLRTHKLWLETGIVLMGARISLDSVLGAGPRLLLVVVAVVTFTLLLVETLSRTIFDMEGPICSLLACGLSICGVSAVVAVAGSIRADENQIAYAVATVLLFDAVTLFVYPSLGVLLGLPDMVYGIWAGVSMLSTGPVAAAGFAYSDVAGQWATLTKLTRNMLIGVAVIGYSVYHTRQSAAGTGLGNSLRCLWQSFPKFILGFVAVMVAASVGLLSSQQVTSMTNAYRWLFLVAFAGLGLNIQVDEMREAGLKPVGVAVASLVTVSVLALAMVTVLF